MAVGNRPAASRLTARICCSNWKQAQASMVQWPLLWTRGCDLIDQQRSFAADKQLHREDADYVQRIADRPWRSPWPLPPCAGVRREGTVERRRNVVFMFIFGRVIGGERTIRAPRRTTDAS